MFSPADLAELEAVARRHDIEPAAFAAVCEVECGGAALYRIAGKAEPPIRFEGHYFYRLLARQNRNRAVAAGLAHPRAGGVANPRSQTARWKRLARACSIDRPAALESTSWGIGQVMGAHWRWLGHASIDAFVGEARSGLAGQARLMALYIVKAGLTGHLERGDWAGFARAYNGPGYAANRYDRRLADAYVRLGGRYEAPSRHERPVLRAGSQGGAVEDLQRWLRALGHPLIADGDFGPATERALRSFQAEAGVAADGAFGAESFLAMARRLPRETLRS
jgi:hypothetical protein